MKHSCIAHTNTLKLFISSALLMFFLYPAVAQTTVAQIKVWGNCEMCKKRIEYAAKAKGVEKPVWDIDTHILSLVYDSTKISLAEIEKKIAKAGHDTENERADDKAYQRLHHCCKYERKE